MTRTSLIDTVDIPKMVTALRQENLEAAETRRKDAFLKLVATIDDLGSDIAEGHRKPIDALIAEATYMERLGETLDGNRDQITAGFTGALTSPSTQSNQDQVRQLEGRAQDAERQLGDLRDENDELRRSAERASDLQVKLDEAKAEIRRLESENRDLRSQTDRPNPLKAENDSLKADKRRLESENRDLRSRNTELESENTRLQEENRTVKDGLQRAGDIMATPLPDDTSAQAQPEPVVQPDTPAPAGSQPDGSQDSSFIDGAMDRQNGGSDSPAPKPGLGARLKSAVSGSRVDRRGDN